MAWGAQIGNDQRRGCGLHRSAAIVRRSVYESNLWGFRGPHRRTARRARRRQNPGPISDQGQRSRSTTAAASSIGMAVIVSADNAARAMALLRESGETVWQIGSIRNRQPGAADAGPHLSQHKA